MSVKSFKARVKRLVLEKHEVGLQWLAAEAEAIYRDELAEPYPPSSRPGEHPHTRTGNLIASVTHGLEADRLVSFMGVTAQAKYIEYLIQSGRLGPADVVTPHRDRLVSAYRQGVATVQ